MDAELIAVLEDVRGYFGRPVHVYSGCRCQQRNKDVSGAKGSQHLYGKGADIEVEGVRPDEVWSYLDRRHPTSLGLGRYRGWTHVDTRNGYARWAE